MTYWEVSYLGHNSNVLYARNFTDKNEAYQHANYATGTMLIWTDEDGVEHWTLPSAISEVQIAEVYEGN